MTERIIDRQEVQRHSVRGDSWVIVGGGVYDVSEFVEKHPGGADLLLSHAGNDVSAFLHEDSYHRHSPAAFSMLESYRIGQLRNELKQNGNGCFVHRSGGAFSQGISGSVPQSSRNRCNGHANGHKGPVWAMVNGWREEDLVDWTKPMLWQVGGLGEVYNKWVHSPVDKPLRLFHSGFVEFFSRTPWFVIPLVWLPVLLFLAMLSLRGVKAGWMPFLSPAEPLTVIAFSLWFCVGGFLWTLIEYLLHRFLFHMAPPDTSPFLITVHFLLHGQHHKVPFEPYRLVFPPVAASIIFFIFYFLTTSLLPLNAGRSVMTGGLLGYICYDLIHYYLHHGTPKHGSYLNRLKSYHVQHHFTDHKAGFGISSKFWDIPFGTHSSQQS